MRHPILRKKFITTYQHMQPINIPTQTNQNTKRFHQGSSESLRVQLVPVSARLDSLLQSLAVNEFSEDEYCHEREDSEPATVQATDGDMVDSWGNLTDNITLAQVQAASSTISGFLIKLNGNSSDSLTGADRWKERYFVLSEDGNLFLFKSSANPFALPITFLPISACSAYYDSQDSSPMLRVVGTGTTGGVIVKRIWTLRCPDEDSLGLWIRSINRVLSTSHLPVTTSARLSRSSSVSGSFSGVTPRFSQASTASAISGTTAGSSASLLDAQTSSLYEDRKLSFSKVLPMARSNSSSTSSSITTTVNVDEREAAQRQRYQEYLLTQKQVADRVQRQQRELTIQREREEKERVERKKREQLEHAEQEKKEKELADKKMRVKEAIAVKKYEKDMAERMALYAPNFIGRF